MAVFCWIGPLVGFASSRPSPGPPAAAEVLLIATEALTLSLSATFEALPMDSYSLSSQPAHRPCQPSPRLTFRIFLGLSHRPLYD